MHAMTSQGSFKFLALKSSELTFTADSALPFCIAGFTCIIHSLESTFNVRFTFSAKVVGFPWTPSLGRCSISLAFSTESLHLLSLLLLLPLPQTLSALLQASNCRCHQPSLCSIASVHCNPIACYPSLASGHLSPKTKNLHCSWLPSHSFAFAVVSSRSGNS